MSTGNEQSSPRQRSVLYIVVSVVFVILAVWAVIAFSSARGAQRAAEMADELVQTLEEAGATATRSPRSSPGCSAMTAARCAPIRTRR